MTNKFDLGFKVFNFKNYLQSLSKTTEVITVKYVTTTQPQPEI